MIKPAFAPILLIFVNVVLVTVGQPAPKHGVDRLGELSAGADISLIGVGSNR